MGDTLIKCVEETYLDSVVTPKNRMDAEVYRCIESASKAVGALQYAVFEDRNLNIIAKKPVYQPCELHVLMYGSECWVPLHLMHSIIAASALSSPTGRI